jgi:hypothetical protein
VPAVEPVEAALPAEAPEEVRWAAAGKAIRQLAKSAGATCSQREFRECSIYNLPPNVL